MSRYFFQKRWAITIFGLYATSSEGMAVSAERIKIVEWNSVVLDGAKVSKENMPNLSDFVQIQIFWKQIYPVDLYCSLASEA